MTARGQFTYQEILSQPQAWAAALQELQAQRPALEALWRNNYNHILFTGCGSTYYLALAAAALTQQLSGLPCRGLPASELWLYPQSSYPCQGRVLLVAISRSGETTETLRACTAFCEARRGDLLTLSCYPEMPLAGMGDLNLVFPSGQEQSVAQTRAFSTLYLATVALALTATSESGPALEALQALPAAGSRILDAAIPLARTLGQDFSLERFYFLGSGPRHGLASEISLKMKEMSLSHSEPFHFLEFRHGPKSMITPSALVVGLLSETNRAAESAVLSDMQAMNARLLVINDGDLAFPPGLPEALRNVLYLPPGQLLAFERSMAKGLNPDRPNNLDTVVYLK